MIFLYCTQKLNIGLLCPCYKLEVAVKEGYHYGHEGQKNAHDTTVLSLSIVKPEMKWLAIDICNIHASLALLFKQRQFIR